MGFIFFLMIIVFVLVLVLLACKVSKKSDDVMEIAFRKKENEIKKNQDIWQKNIEQ